MELDEIIKKIKFKKAYSLDKIYEKVRKFNPNISMEEVKEYLDGKVGSYEFFLTPNNNYEPIGKSNIRVGTYKAYRDGSGVVICDNEKFKISEEDKGPMISGDTVMIDITSKKEPKFYKLISRDNAKTIGTIVKENETYYVRSDDPDKKNLEIRLPEGDYIEGQIVSVDFSKELGPNLYEANILKEIGFKDDPGVDIQIEAYKHGISNEISDDIKAELELIPKKVLDTDFIGRSDLRDMEIFTIDGSDTKDIDDAVSLQMLPNGNFKLGVHIADVSHYVKRGSKIYDRAYELGCSNYLGNTVIPMLPHELSNGICSLNPGVDRLALSVFMEIDRQGNVVNSDMVQSVINSKLKMDYGNVNKIFEKKDYDSKYEPFVSTLNKMNLLAHILRRKRFKEGAINFDKPELKLITDKDGNVIDVDMREQKDAENLIEEFMLVANITVAKIMSEYPFVYRVHEEPDPSNVNDYIKMLDDLNYEFRYTSDTPNVCQHLADYFNSHKNDPLADMLKTKLIRSFKKAYYSCDSTIGHFGLAFPCYTHFTSPIRRLTDQTVHELIHDFKFSDKDKEELVRKWKNELPAIAKQASYREVEERDCERQVLYMKCAEYMKNHIGEDFPGTIISIDDKGMDVELDNMIEGRVRLRDLPKRGKYESSTQTYSFVSLNGLPDYYIGDRVMLECTNADKERKEVDFKILSKIKENDRIDKEVNDSVKTYKKSNNYNKIYFNSNKGRR